MRIVEEKEKNKTVPEEEKAGKESNEQETSEPEKMEQEAKEKETAKDAESGKETEQDAAGAAIEDGEKTDTIGAGHTGKDKKGPHKKSREDKKTEALNGKITELEDKVKRQLAEFENFRNRTEKEKSMMFETGARSVIEKILPVVDNFERGLAGLSEEEKEAPFAAGMLMVYKQLQTELENLDVKPIEAVGHEFDPNFHNAVMQVESEEYESGTVAQEMMKGYTYRDTVIRHSMVAVVS